MAIAYKRKLSGSTSGRGIKVAATASAGTTIHTAVADTSAGTWDELWLWAVNSDTTARKLTIEFGGTTSPDDLIEQTVPPESGLMLVVPGLVLQNGLIVRAFASAADVVIVHGFVNTVTD
jgi:hypothetical protein